MQVPKRYIHDKVVLVLLSTLVFVILLTALNIIIRIVMGGGGDYFVEYRSTVGISAFRAGGASEILAFIWFSIIIAVATVILSARTYGMKRQLSHVILIFGVFLAVLSLIVSHALLVLR